MAENGFVTLVGAGPGDPGLLTLAGREAIAQAEVVLYDALVGAPVLAMLPPDAEKIRVGKNKGNHPVPQAEINRLLVEWARRGKRVVRLKGGDPYLFGRGAEELELLRDSGIPFRVIPGVTSALAVPAYAGIPVTHREYSSSLHIVTGHGKDGGAPELRYRELAGAGGTLVFLMGTSNMAEICAGLLAGGLPPGTPAAVVENGTLPGQRKCVATVADIAARAAEAGIASPAVLIIGAVCALGERYAWTEFLPLWGRDILAVSSRTIAGKLAGKLRALGCGVDELAVIRVEPVELSAYFWQGVPEYDWVVLTSQYGAELFFDGLLRQGLDVRRLARTRFAVVGPRTADALKANGVLADLVPASYNGADLARELAERARPGDKLLIFRARDVSEDLVDILRDRGVAYDEVAAYRTRLPEVDFDNVRRKLEAGDYDAVTFGSASAADAFAAMVDSPTLEKLQAVCIGRSTASAAFEAGMNPLVAAEATVDGMVALIVGKWGRETTTGK